MEYIQAHPLEIAIGVALGAGLGLAVASPLATGLTSFLPTHAFGVWPVIQSAFAAGLAMAGGAAGGICTARQEQDGHITGTRYISDFDRAKRALQATERERFSAMQRAGKKRGVTIGGVELALAREVGHIYCVGVPGAGKTTILNGIIDQALARGERLVIHDPKGELTARYFGAGDAVLLGPWDERAAIWNAARDMATPQLIKEFCTRVVYGGQVDQSGKGQNDFFYRASATLFTGLLCSYLAASETWTWSDFRDAIETMDPITLVQRAAQGDAAVRMMFASAFPPPGSSKPPELKGSGGDVLATLGAYAGWLRDMGTVDSAYPDALRFSLRDWLLGTAHRDIRLVILNSNSVYEQAGTDLFGSMLSTAAATLSSAEMPERSPDEPGIWFILDELPQLGAGSLKKVRQIEEIGRDRGARVVLAMQDESQLVAAAGRDQAKPMTAVQSTVIYTHTSSDAAKEISNRLGQCEVWRFETTGGNGAVQGKTKRRHTKQAILPSALTGLDIRESMRPFGAELILHIGDTLGWLVQPFATRCTNPVPKYVESVAWTRGSLPAGPRDGNGVTIRKEQELARALGEGLEPAVVPAPPPSAQAPGTPGRDIPKAGAQNLDLDL